MYIKSVVELIYEGLTVDETGSPINVSVSKVARCDEMETFSSNYYNEQQRNMRTSRNLVIPTYLTYNIVDNDGIKYELMYCVYNNAKYRVKNILKLRRNKNTYGNTRQKMILDIDEVR